MKKCKYVFFLMAAVLGFASCEAPDQYVVRGVFYTDSTFTITIPMDTIRFTFYGSGAGYTVTDARGRFSFLFYTDGLGNEQPAPKLAVNEGFHRLTLTYKGDTIYSDEIELFDDKMAIYPGYYADHNQRGGRK